ncbi:DUF992 domain-containing protein [Kumtagia ephedrae]|uniref:DUF992 domain-containing protein n=1 Tax=Kumtagia ephedrae TaxID=2116701 RepID=A0A2P7STL5_9HYPH|nr:DUF992 domain-containing protein [Mesorhizobium ephedrae]PSJ65814.1 DUF992 domain-containing protein [Mesorhizobium ephedrae]
MKNTSKFCRIASIAGAVIALSLSFGGPAWSNTQIGLLKCDTSIGIGQILVRKQTMACTFTHTNGQVEKYTGTIHQYGIELGEVEEGHLVWGVFAASPAPGSGLLAGKYGGVAASVAAGIGLGVDVLVGGIGKSFSLQPLAVEGEPGVGIAAGVEEVELVAAK